MNQARAIVIAAFAVGTAVWISGCAPAYHRFESPCTSYEYCKRAPLPYSVYSDCCPQRSSRTPVVVNVENP